MPGRPRADSMPSPGEQTDRRIANTELSRFASLDSHRGRPSRTLEALDLATPHSPTFKAIASQMKEAGKHTLDPHLLAGALGVKGGKRDKLAAEIQKRMQGHQDKQAAFLNQFKNKGFAGLHEMPGAAMKGANKQLSAFLEHKGKKK
jgi:hypothetical protein